MSVQVIMVIGRLGTPFEMRETKTGTPMATARVAANTRRGGQDLTTWYTIKIFGQLAHELCAQSQKGQNIYAKGKPEAYAWVPKNGGDPKCELQIIAEEVKLLSGQMHDMAVMGQEFTNPNSTEPTEDDWDNW